MRIYIIRHGESYSNTGGRVLSYTDLELTEKGKQQAERAGKVWRDTLHSDRPVYAFCSDLIRTRQTGEAFLKGAELDIAMTATHDLTEMNLGRMEGMTWAEREAAFPDIHTDTGLSEACMPGGESFSDVKARSLHFAENCLSVPELNAAVLVFTHGLTMRILINVLLGKPDGDVNRLNWFENTSVTEIEYDVREKKGHCLRLNDCAHLGELGAGDYTDWGVFCKEPYLT